MSLADLPEFTLQKLLLRGLVIDTALLRGWNLDDLHTLRNRADQAGCPCLVLRETLPIEMNINKIAGDEPIIKRLSLVARAAHRLGCNAMTIRLHAALDDGGMDRTADFLRSLMLRIERMELNLLLEPWEGDLDEPEVLINLIKKVGGFRIGTMPNFAHAIAHQDIDGCLQQTAPYAGAILASCGLGTGSRSTTSKKTSKAPAAGKALLKKELTDLRACVNAIRKVGYSQILAIDYIGPGNGIRAIEQTRDIIDEILDSK